MLNTVRPNNTLWELFTWWFTILFERPTTTPDYAPAPATTQIAADYVDIGRKFPIPADKLDYYYTAAD